MIFQILLLDLILCQYMFDPDLSDYTKLTLNQTTISEFSNQTYPTINLNTTNPYMIMHSKKIEEMSTSIQHHSRLFFFGFSPMLIEEELKKLLHIMKYESRVIDLTEIMINFNIFQHEENEQIRTIFQESYKASINHNPIVLLVRHIDVMFSIENNPLSTQEVKKWFLEQLNLYLNKNKSVNNYLKIVFISEKPYNINEVYLEELQPFKGIFFDFPDANEIRKMLLSSLIHTEFANHPQPLIQEKQPISTSNEYNVLERTDELISQNIMDFKPISFLQMMSSVNIKTSLQNKLTSLKNHCISQQKHNLLKDPTEPFLLEVDGILTQRTCVHFSENLLKTINTLISTQKQNVYTQTGIRLEDLNDLLQLLIRVHDTYLDRLNTDLEKQDLIFYDEILEHNLETLPRLGINQANQLIRWGQSHGLLLFDQDAIFQNSTDFFSNYLLSINPSFNDILKEYHHFIHSPEFLGGTPGVLAEKEFVLQSIIKEIEEMSKVRKVKNGSISIQKSDIIKMVDDINKQITLKLDVQANSILKKITENVTKLEKLKSGNWNECRKEASTVKNETIAMIIEFNRVLSLEEKQANNLQDNTNDILLLFEDIQGETMRLQNDQHE